MTSREANKIRMPFGHYVDFTLGEIAEKDPLYLDYMAGQSLRDNYLREAITVLVQIHDLTIAEKKARGEKPLLLARPVADVFSGPKPQQLKLF